MTALSRHFTRAASTDLRVGTPPDDCEKPLSRKVQSELDLIKLARMNTAESVANSSITSGFSGGTGDPLPDEIPSSPPALAEITIDCDAVFAIREVNYLRELCARLVLTSCPVIVAWYSGCAKTRSRCGQVCQRPGVTAVRRRQF
jgi:hypothetical protein